MITIGQIKNLILTKRYLFLFDFHFRPFFSFIVFYWLARSLLNKHLLHFKVLLHYLMFFNFFILYFTFPTVKDHNFFTFTQCHLSSHELHVQETTLFWSKGIYNLWIVHITLTTIVGTMVLISSTLIISNSSLILFSFAKLGVFVN